ncbi:MAG TPA: YncE family protein, partial [Acidimicrobiales bacterium]|nr:YncE family protein [Acidimicrobiales bacterium]
MRRLGIVGLVVMSVVLAGCGAATLTESVTVSVEGAPAEQVHASLAPQPMPFGRLRTSAGISQQPVAVADGETAIVTPTGGAAPVVEPSLLVGPSMPGPVGPAWPTVETRQVAPSAPVNIYSHTLTPDLSPAVAGVPLRAYVPNSDAASVSVIDPTTMKVVDRFNVGTRPHHVTPSWDLTKLYVNNTEGNTLTEIDPRTGRPTRNIPITDPYNLYFTPDGTKAIVVAERYMRLDFYNTADWTFLKSVGVPWAGVDHGDFSPDGRYFMASCEFSGQVVKVD